MRQITESDRTKLINLLEYVINELREKRKNLQELNTLNDAFGLLHTIKKSKKICKKN